ncbi:MULTISPECIES: 16S rRNA (cytosine(1402)-N(4))-methyltransferase RsmH [unclassified Roseitalea]|uniref:16S rRNA (cytosine(1402)-N(4))-methyltransferase RsmH n=1 Tax=unclassified Roseitalea TaxID=2639107 RepID=UPI00273E6D5B|nr:MULTISPECIES: 16S rRNA (cytosine(1402)-N(4))-methyltransferase RsmH [unclassified Roseitalea]
MSGPVPHVPVMLAEVLAALDPRPGERHVDGTFGAGGYSRAILAAGADVIAFDRDPDAVAGAAALVAEHPGRLDVIEAPFSTMADHVAPASVHGVVFDVGVSSMQLDESARGFSFRRDGPLDMRMAQSGPSAADVVNDFDVKDLIRIIGILGEERNAPAIAHAIERARADRRIETTGALVAVIESVQPRRARDPIHPATRTFQGLRIFVNDELRELARALFAAERVLRPGGRLVVVSFHSLEDRIVKRFIQDRTTQSGGSRHLPASAPQPLTFAVTGKAVVAASKAEAADNPRARSAKLRAATRTGADPRPADMTLFRLADLPWPQRETGGGAKP